MEASIVDQQIQTRQKFWTIPQIFLASYLAGPIGGCYFVGRNYRELGSPDLAKRSYLFGLGGTILLFLLFFLIPENIVAKIPSSIIPLSITSVISSIAQAYQKKEIDERLNDGGKRFSYWWCVLIALSLLVLQLPLFFIAGIMFGSTS